MQLVFFYAGNLTWFSCSKNLAEDHEVKNSNMNTNWRESDIGWLSVSRLISPGSSESGPPQEDLFDHPLSLSQTLKPSSATEVPIHDTDLTAAANGYTDVG